jgi:hypothetical protein
MNWGDEYADQAGIDWKSFLVIVLLVFGLFLEALWVS